MTEIESPHLGALKKVRWAARIISLLPGAAIILGLWGIGVYNYLRIGKPEILTGSLLSGTIYGLLPLLIGVIACKWSRAGGISLILMSALFFLFAWTPGNDVIDPIFCFSFGAAFLIGGILHLVVSRWGRRL